MTDHTTSTTIRRLAAGLVASCALAVPAALLATNGPANAGPSSLTISHDGCTFAASGNYGYIELYMTYNGRTGLLTASVNGGAIAGYASNWLLPVGDTATFTAKGWDGGQVVATEAVVAGSCDWMSYPKIVLTASEDGAPTPGANTYGVEIQQCSNPANFVPVVPIAAGDSREIPVSFAADVCLAAVDVPQGVSDISFTPSPVNSGYAGNTVNLHAVYEAGGIPELEPPIEPVDPGVDPVDPEVELGEPPIEPVDPGVDPVDPGSDPVDAPIDPVDPGSDPIDPIGEGSAGEQVAGATASPVAAPASPVVVSPPDPAEVAGTTEPGARSRLPRTGGTPRLASLAGLLLALGAAARTARRRVVT